jgi:hypothetical protein
MFPLWVWKRLLERTVGAVIITAATTVTATIIRWAIRKKLREKDSVEYYSNQKPRFPIYRPPSINRIPPGDNDHEKI